MPTARRPWLFLLPLALFLLLVCSELVERSMYTDGVAYAGLSLNLAEGRGTFWSPKLSEVHHVSFREHPPLVFGIQSLFFRLFGNGIVTERLYALFVFLLSAGGLVLLWRELLRGRPAVRRLWWLPLTLWLANEVVYHFYPANVLEPTMTLFLLAAVGAGLRALRPGTPPGPQFALAAVAGLLVFGGTLCKGFVALFPLALFGIHWVVFRRWPPGRVVLLALVATAAVGLAYAVLLQHAPAREALERYFDTQVMASISGERSHERHFRDSRFYIIEKALLIGLPAAAVALLLWGLSHRWARARPEGAPCRRAGLLCWLLGAAASFPLAVSPKQSIYYLLPSMAFFALGYALVAAPAAAALLERPRAPRTTRLINGLLVLLVLGGLANTYRHWGEVVRRDEVTLTDIEKLNTVLPWGATVGSAGNIESLVSYAYRTHRVSIDTVAANRLRYDFVVAPRRAPALDLPEVELGLREYVLYRND